MKSKYDLWSLFIVFLCVGIHVFGLQQPLSYLSIPFILFSSTVVFMAFHVNHNQMHLPIFSAPSLKVLNWVVNGLLSISIFSPVSILYVPHLVNHHPNYCNEEDWTGRHLAGNSRGIIRVFRYNFAVLLNFIKTGRAVNLSDLPKNRLTSSRFELVFLFLFTIWALATSSWSVFLLHYFLPTFLGLNGMIFMNFFVHDGCDPDIRLKSCRSFISFVPNFLTVNNGYHLAHHEFPNEHWSNLPALHKSKYSHLIENKYQHSSALSHFVKHYILGRPFE